MSSFFVVLLFGIAAALGDIVGGLVLTANKRWGEGAFLRYFIALSVGFMLALALLEMIPESMRLTPLTPSLVLLAYLLVHFFEHTMPSHFHFGEEIHPEAMVKASVGYLAFLGLAVHSFFDGISIAAGFSVSHSLGVLVFSGVLLHKLPEGFTIASIMVAAGHGRARALGSAVAIGLATMVGVLFLSLASGLAPYGLALSAGALLYVAASDLMPEVNKEVAPRMAFVVFAGVLLFYLAERLLGQIGS
jgi:zinc transporter ZupT